MYARILWNPEYPTYFITGRPTNELSEYETGELEDEQTFTRNNRKAYNAIVGKERLVKKRKKSALGEKPQSSSKVKRTKKGTR